MLYPLLKLLRNACTKNHRSAVICEDFVASEITNLLKSGCIKEVLSDNVYIVSPLSVASNNGKKRLILDLHYLNGFLRVQHFQYEDLRTFKDIFSQGDWFFKFDYKSGYHHVDIPRTLEVPSLLLGYRTKQALLCIYGPRFWLGYRSFHFY